MKGVMTPFLTVYTTPIMDNQRLLLYVSLVLVLYLIWQAWQEQYGPKPSTPEHVSQNELPEISLSPREENGDALDVPDASASVSTLPKSQQEATGERIRVITDLLDVDISTRGGNILRADLLTYPVSLNTPDVPFRLFDDQRRIYIAQSGLVYDNTRQDIKEPWQLAPSHHAEFTAEKAEYRLPVGEEKLQVPLTWRGPNGVTVKKIMIFHRGHFFIDVVHKVTNQGTEPWIGSQYRQLRHSELEEKKSSRFVRTYTGAAYYDGKYEKVPFKDMTEKPLNLEVKGGWAAMLQHYFVSAWIPRPEERNLYYTKVVTHDREPEYLIGLRSQPITVAPGETGTFSTRLFVGPKLRHRLDDLAEGLDLVTDYGIFTVISKPLFWTLEFIHSWIGNWGWAIIFLTILIKLAFYKLSETSYRSMARMRSVQPRLIALKERYASDKQKMNQALMELYRKEKINPLGGCLPILIQIPVFIALYWALLESVELRQASFMFWINDLSTRDPYFVLPILMGITMVIQQKLNPTPLDPVQAKVMMILPLVFTVFFAFFPSGLVLYWLVNNVLSIAQQWVITRRIEQMAR
jgi:YidC/Oxa1 family membrane protein insertase